MKKNKIIKFASLSLTVLLISSATICNLTNCSNNILAPVVPETFYWKNDHDYTGAGCSFPQVTNYIKVQDYNQVYNLLTDRKNYPDRYVQWDIIHTWVLDKTVTRNGSFIGKIIHFQRTTNSICYEVQITFENQKPINIFTTSRIGSEDRERKPWTISNEQSSYNIASKDELYSTYECQTAGVWPYPVSYLKSVFFKTI